MRRPTRLLLAPLAAALVLTGCGDSVVSKVDTLSPQQALSQVGAKTKAGGSSKFLLSSVTKAGTQTIEFGGEGAFDYATTDGQLTVKVGGLEVELLIVKGTAYVKVPGESVFSSIPLKDLAGTSFGSNADPTSSLDQLKGASDDVTEVGKETVRGAETTHYRGTLDLRKAAEQVQGAAKAMIEKNLAKLKDPVVPFDAFIDAEGRMRKLTQTIAASDPRAGEISSVVTVELFDFGTKVDVQAPPADQVKDGSALLKQFLGQA